MENQTAYKPTLNDFLTLQSLNKPVETKIPIDLTLLYNFSRDLYKEFEKYFLCEMYTKNNNFLNFIQAQLSKEIFDKIFIGRNLDFENNGFLAPREVNCLFHLFNPLPTSIVPIGLLRPSAHLSSIIEVPGIVTKVGNIIPELLVGVFKCDVCGIISDPIIQGEEYTTPIVCRNQICGNRSSFSILDNYNDMSNYELDERTKEVKFQIKNNDNCKFGNLQRIVIQEEINYQNKLEKRSDSIPRVLTCVLRKDLCDTIKPGDKVKLIGKMIVLLNHNTENARLQTVKSVPTLTGFGEEIRKRRAINFKELDYVYQMEVNSVSFLDTLKITGNISQETQGGFQGKDVFSSEQLKTIENMRNDPNLYNKLANSIFPSIQGHLNIKKSILLQLISGVAKDFSTLKNKDGKTKDTTRLRGDINILLVGDPGTAKSQFLKQASKILLNSIYTAGKTSTAAGLTAAVVKDATSNSGDNKNRGDFSIEPGALVLADNSLCCIDEFDKISVYDRVSIHEAMEQQTISIAKAGLNCTLNARTSILAAANPLDGRYDESKSLYQNINLSAPIFSRFDLCFVLIDEKSEIRDWNIADKIIKNHVLGNSTFNPTFSIEELKGEELFSIKDAQLFIHSVKDATPLIPPSTQFLISKKFVTLRKLSVLMDGNKKGYKFSIRHLESIIRLSEAQAKLFSDPIVSEEYVEESCRLLGCAGTTNSNPSLMSNKSLNLGNKETEINLDVTDKENKLNTPANKKIINSEKFFKIMNSYIFILKTNEQMTEEELLMSYLEILVDQRGVENEREWNSEELQKEKELAKNVLSFLIMKENVLIRENNFIMLHPMYDA
ncbi:DNA replication licensing factor Mcm6 [Cucumispora dikerogammari]|nr:DNA replication licensing factor Mcm6 [Cucumispora dikerogammari]